LGRLFGGRGQGGLSAVADYGCCRGCCHDPAAAVAPQHWRLSHAAVAPRLLSRLLSQRPTLRRLPMLGLLSHLRGCCRRTPSGGWGSPNPWQDLRFCESSRSIATVTTSAGFRAALGIYDYIHEGKGILLTRIPPAFLSALACPKTMSAWWEMRICQTPHWLPSRLPSPLVSPCCGCYRAHAVPPPTNGPSKLLCPAALRRQPQHCDGSRDSSQ
jgi:hypothetical protein